MTPVVVPSGTLSDDDLLGHLVMYTVPDKMLDYATLVAAWVGQGLDAAMLPVAGDVTDVFRLACTSVQTKRRGASEVVHVEAASKDGTVYQVTRSVRDWDNRVVEHPKAMTLVFDRDSERITVTRREDYDALSTLERKIKANYKSFKDQVPGSKVRTAVRETLLYRLAATNWYTTKGIYFVAKKHEPVLKKLERALQAAYNGDSRVTLIEVLDTKAHRADVIHFHTGDIKDRVSTLMETIAGKLDTGASVRSDMMDNIHNQYQQIHDQREAIRAVVGSETKEVDAALATLAMQVEALVVHVNTKKVK